MSKIATMRNKDDHIDENDNYDENSWLLPWVRAVPNTFLALSPSASTRRWKWGLVEITTGKHCDIYTSDNSDSNDDYDADKSDNDENPTSASETGDHLYFLDFPPWVVWTLSTSFGIGWKVELVGEIWVFWVALVQACNLSKLV